jgi:prevent-host-death family protein
MKPREIGTLEAKTHFSNILDEVEQGQRFYITRHGKKIAELSPVKAEKKRPKFGCGKGLITYIAPDFDEPLDDFKDYRP